MPEAGGVVIAEGQNDETIDAVRAFLFDLVVDLTGYDREIIDFDADLESELGVDSIKRAQLLGELEQQFELQSIRQSDVRLADFPTLASIHQFVVNQVEGGTSEDDVTPTVEHSSTDINATAVVPAASYKQAVSVQTSRYVPSDVPQRGTHRFTLGVRPSERLAGMPTVPFPISILTT